MVEKDDFQLCNTHYFLEQSSTYSDDNDVNTSTYTSTI